jgi:hypothetical protein
MTNPLNNELAAAANVPNGFLNAAQRTIIIDWIVETEEETSLMDGETTVEEIAEMRKSLESMPNPELRREMKAIGSATLNRAVRKAATA